MGIRRFGSFGWFIFRGARIGRNTSAIEGSESFAGQADVVVSSLLYWMGDPQGVRWRHL